MDTIHVSDYEIVVSENNVATVYYRGEQVWQSRACRLSVQAERLAREWVSDSVDDFHANEITLNVQNLIIDPDTLFGGNKRYG